MDSICDLSETSRNAPRYPKLGGYVINVGGTTRKILIFFASTGQNRR